MEEVGRDAALQVDVGLQAAEHLCILPPASSLTVPTPRTGRATVLEGAVAELRRDGEDLHLGKDDVRVKRQRALLKPEPCLLLPGECRE